VNFGDFMVLTKLTFTSVEMDFPNFEEFMNYAYYIMGHNKFIELAYIFTDPIVEGTMLPYEKVRWNDDGKGGFIQRYHENSVQSKEFQIKLTKSPVFVELQQALGGFQISMTLEMLPSDEFNLSDSVEVDFIDLKGPGAFLRPGK
jgi:hypothetical protein